MRTYHIDMFPIQKTRIIGFVNSELLYLKDNSYGMDYLVVDISLFADVDGKIKFTILKQYQKEIEQLKRFPRFLSLVKRQTETERFIDWYNENKWIKELQEL